MTRTPAPPVAPIAVSVAGVAAMLGVSERTVHDLRRTDPTFPLPRDLTGRGTCLRWSVDELAAWLHARPTHETVTEPPQLVARRYRCGRLAGGAPE